MFSKFYKALFLSVEIGNLLLEYRSFASSSILMNLNLINQAIYVGIN